jgi:ribonuclease P protein subunit POP4
MASLPAGVSGEKFTREWVEGLFPDQSTGESAWQSKVATKVVMLDNPVVSRPPKPPPKAKVMTSKERRATKATRVGPENRRFESYIPLHQLWCQYMVDLLQLASLPSQS